MAYFGLVTRLQNCRKENSTAPDMEEAQEEI